MTEEFKNKKERSYLTMVIKEAWTKKGNFVTLREDKQSSDIYNQRSRLMVGVGQRWRHLNQRINTEWAERLTLKK